MDYAPLVQDFRAKIDLYVNGKIDYKSVLKAKRAVNAQVLRQYWGENAILIAIIVENIRGLKSGFAISRYIDAISALNFSHNQKTAKANNSVIDVKKRAAGDYDD